jgi:hypothetical protein
VDARHRSLLSGAPRQAIDFAAIDAVRQVTPMQPEPAGEFMRKMRDGYRY